jgi:hypothetical protein
VVAAPQPQIDLSASSPLPTFGTDMIASSLADNSSALDARFESMARSAPISGRILRAHLASLLN